MPDALPAEYAAELAHLQANAPPMGWNFVRRRMSSELGPDWQSKFESFGHEAAAAASLGQVHRARLHDGTDVACKLQYPDMPSTVDADLRQLRLAMAIYHRMDNAIQHEEVYKELSERLREELDYEREAAQMRLYHQLLANDPTVHVPVPIAGHCTHRLLTMTWLDGRPLMHRLAEDPPQEERNRIAEALFRAWYVPFYRYGVIHGDPHLGNCQVRPDVMRDGHIAMVAQYGRIGWQRLSGYNRRSLVETAIYRYKTMIGRRLCARSLLNQHTEAKIGCNALNRMTSFGMPVSVRRR